MKITETVTRDCCQSKDLKPVEGSNLFGRSCALKFCIHCGARWEYYTFMDAAGSTDWDYRKVDEPKT